MTSNKRKKNVNNGEKKQGKTMKKRKRKGNNKE